MGRARWRRFSGWRAPPNWSPRDWREEVYALRAAAVCQAEHDFDPARGASRTAFVWGRVAASVLTRYRQEWSFARHCHAGTSGERQVATTAQTAPESEPVELDSLQSCFALLSESDRDLLDHLFWQGQTEAEAAHDLHTSQATISRRKHALLDRMRRAMDHPTSNRPDRE